ncbi:GtrA family protein [Hyphomonas sp.]|uniref:GtrA family protein n=1 Tax=Hyphomonas sp. TaxID=87 RepID=UPI0025BDBAFF|nr:GtrA family protein [Hyphomonas sp.]
MTLPFKLSKATVQFAVRYTITGLAVTAVYVGLYFLLRNLLTLSPAFASGISMTSAVVFQYVMHSVFTFQRKWADGGQLVKFVVSIFISVIVADIFVARLGVALNVPEPLRLLAVVVTLPIVNFLFFTFWVYAAKRD